MLNPSLQLMPAERDSAALLPVQLEGSLFQALDGEADVGIAGHIKATLRTLLRAGAPGQPSRWLAMCSDVVLATTTLSLVSRPALPSLITELAN